MGTLSAILFAVLYFGVLVVGMAYLGADNRVRWAMAVSLPYVLIALIFEFAYPGPLLADPYGPAILMVLFIPLAFGWLSFLLARKMRAYPRVLIRTKKE